MSHNKVVLVVDDVPSIVQLIRGALADQAVDLVAAADGQTGLDLARSLLPDLILLDLALPVVDGWDVLAALKADDATASVPVVIVTAHGDSDSASRARGGGASAFIAKPFRPAELRRIIAKMLEPLAAAG